MSYKPDSDQIRSCLENLKHAQWLGPDRSWWPDHLFHFTNITNVANIIKMGYLYSRGVATQQKISFVSAASPEIISNPYSRKWENYVRFYFRPLTPTLFSNEGIRPQNSRKLNAHCPVPVYLLFDAPELLCTNGTQFSSIGLARSDATSHADATHFCKLLFRNIYHTGPVNPDNRDLIISSRHAEVIVPQQIDLTHLKRIWCRSAAEYDTLRYLLGPYWPVWANKITFRSDRSLFNRQWTYVSSVGLQDDRVYMSFNTAAKATDQGEFKIRAEFTLFQEDGTTERYYWEDATYYVSDANQRLVLPLPSTSRPITSYRLRLTLNDDLAYESNYTLTTTNDNLPF
jgi:ssDNA thymidine ADP-ribosyltransferase, DarT